MRRPAPWGEDQVLGFKPEDRKIYDGRFPFQGNLQVEFLKSFSVEVGELICEPARADEQRRDCPAEGR